MHLPHGPQKGRDRKLTEIIRQTLANPDATPYGTDLPRVGFMPNDSTGILFDILCEECDALPASAFIAEPLVYRGHCIVEDLEDSRISEAVAYSRFREWRDTVLEWMEGGWLTSGEMKFDDLIDHTLCEMIWDAAYNMDDGGAWIYARNVDPLAAAVEMPLQSSIDEIAAVAVLNKPGAFMCLYDYDGIYIYASPKTQNCATSAAHGHCQAVGDVVQEGPHPTFVLSDHLLKEALEQAEAGGYVHD